MDVQAQMYPENLGLPISSQDWLLMGYNNINNSNMGLSGCGVNEFSFNNLQQKLQQQQLQYQQQQLQYQKQQQQQLLQQPYINQLQNMQKRNASVIDDNSNGFLFATPSKKQKLATTTVTTATTASTTTSESDNHVSPNLSQSFSAQLQKQKLEIDRYISLQHERLKLALQEQRKQQFAALMIKLEEKAMQILRQKDDEISEATKKTMELQEVIRKMEYEKQAWQRVAAENESMAISLSDTLEQLKERQLQQACCSSSSSNAVDDAESCCNFSDNNNNNSSRGKEVTTTCVAETGENRGVFGKDDKETATKETNGSMCKVCNSRKSCMLLLPCRHLSSCKDCEAFLDACPVCKLAKMASIEALMS